LDTKTNEVATKTVENVPQAVHKESGDTVDKVPAEQLESPEIVPPELPTECCWKDNNDCNDLDFS